MAVCNEDFSNMRIPKIFHYYMFVVELCCYCFINFNSGLKIFSIFVKLSTNAEFLGERWNSRGRWATDARRPNSGRQQGRHEKCNPGICSSSAQSRSSMWSQK